MNLGIRPVSVLLRRLLSRSALIAAMLLAVVLIGQAAPPQPALLAQSASITRLPISGPRPDPILRRLTQRSPLTPSAQPQAKPCTPQAGYSDIAAGAPVVVRDQAGATVGSGSLSSGAAEPSRRGCAFHFSVNSLPVASSYTVTVGQRGGLPYSYADLKNSGWNVTMGLGALPPG